MKAAKFSRKLNESSLYNHRYIMDWTELTNDPLDSETILLMKSHLRSISYIYPRDLLSLFVDKARDKDTLHIGCYEHDEKYLKSDAWKHKRIHEVAKSCVGLDINKQGVAHMNELGYTSVHADATSDISLGKEFDVVIAGDVIEHVDNIGGFMSFNSRHSLQNGKIYISTPNPFYCQHVFSAWMGRPMIANFEHTTWISESTMLEIARRSELKLERIIYPIGNSSKSYFLKVLKNLSFKLGSTMLFTTIVYQLSRNVQQK
jgi:SAM-dependent methyltransferase